MPFWQVRTCWNGYFFEVVMKKLEWHTDKGKTRGGFVCHILTAFSMMLLPISSLSQKQSMKVEYAIRPYLITLKLPFTPRFIYYLKGTENRSLFFYSALADL
jgi:hypothetical protein